MDLDKMIGDNCEKGLAEMKVAEADAIRWP
jgi:hypothetical protein